jgi:D-alanyl-D-alanine carboxypeptidase
MQPNDLIKAKGQQIRVLYLTTLVLLLPIFAGVYFLYVEDSKSSQIILKPEQVERLEVSLDTVSITAHSALVISFNTNNIVYQKNPDKPLPLASLTKLVTAQVAQEVIKKENIQVDKMQELSEYGDGQLLENETWNTEDLIAYTLITSSNDGAHTLANNSKNTDSFIRGMNSLVASIGLSTTHFYNETGLDDDTKGIIASKGTAQDISKILSYLIKNDLPLYEKTQLAAYTFKTPHGTQIATNTNEIVEDIAGILVSKTGYTDLAGGNLAVVADMGLNEPTAFVVLKSSKEARFDDILKLQNEYFAQVKERMR